MTRILLLAAALLALPAAANETQIRQALEARFSNVKVNAVHATPVAGLFEVVLRSGDQVQVVYSDALGNYVIDGRLIETRGKRDLTEERLRRATAISMEALPYELAVKVQRGNGRRSLVVFSDPYCPACKQFEKVLIGIDDITVHYFMFPVIRPELADHSRAVWCAPDRAKAWLDLALRGKPSASVVNCDTPIEKIIELGGKLGVASTPTLFLANGERLRGGPNAAQLKAMLDEAKPRR
jgi:thiol:disulfide interchange protein DsbC